MRVITISELLEIRQMFSHSQEIESERETTNKEVLRSTRLPESGPELIGITVVFGDATVTSTYGDVTIEYTEGFEFEENEPDTFRTYTDRPDSWNINAKVIDEDGEELRPSEWSEYLPPKFSQIDYSGLEIHTAQILNGLQFNPCDAETLPVSNQPIMIFTGILLAGASTTLDRNFNNFSGDEGQWEELYIYRVGSHLLCYIAEKTLWSEKKNRFYAKKVDSLEEAREFFGTHKMAEELIDDAQAALSEL